MPGTAADFLNELQAEAPAPGSAADFLSTLHSEAAGQDPGAGKNSYTEQFTSGALQKIANGLGLPVEVVNEALGWAGANFEKKGGDAQAWIRQAFRKFGANPNPTTVEEMRKTAVGKTMSDAELQDYVNQRNERYRTEGKGGLPVLERDPVTLMEKVGGMTPETLLALWGVRSAAPTLASSRPLPTDTGLRAAAQRTAADIGEATLKRPATETAMALGAQPGAILGGEYLGEKAREMGRSVDQAAGGDGSGFLPKLAGAVGEGVGSIVGGGLTAAATSGAGKAAGLVTGDRYGIPRKEMAGAHLVPKESEPIATLGVDAERFTNYAQDQANVYLRRMDDDARTSLQRAYGANPENIGLEELNVRTRQNLGELWRHGRELASMIWGRNDLNMRADTLPLLNFVDSRRDQQLWAGSTVPRDLFQTIRQNIERVIDPGDPANGVEPLRGADHATLRQLMWLRNELEAHRADAMGFNREGKRAPREYIANLNALDDVLLDVMQSADPNNPNMRLARRVSAQVNDRFTRGPLAELIERTRNREFRVGDLSVLEEMFGARGDTPLDTGVGAFVAAQHPYGEPPAAAIGRAPPLPGWNEDTLRATAASAAGRAEVTTNAAGRFTLSTQIGNDLELGMRQSLERDVADAVANQIRDRNPGQTPDVAERAVSNFMRKYQSTLDFFTNAGAALYRTQRELRDLTFRVNEFQNSQLTDIIGKDPQKAAASIYGSKNPVQMTRDIRDMVMQGTAGADRDMAMAAFKKVMIDEFLRRGENSPISWQQRLADPNGYEQGVLRELLGDTKFKRLQYAVDVGVKMETGELATRTRRALATTSGFLAGTFGLILGKNLADFFGTGSAGSLSIPAANKKFFRNAAIDRFAFGDPKKWIADAIVDTGRESELVSKMPGSAQEAYAEVRRMRKTIAVLQAAHEQAQRRLWTDAAQWHRQDDAQGRADTANPYRALRGRPFSFDSYSPQRAQEYQGVQP